MLETGVGPAAGTSPASHPRAAAGSGAGRRTDTHWYPPRGCAPCASQPGATRTRVDNGNCFGGEAAFDYNVLLCQTFYGFRVHVLVAWPGGIVRFSLGPADIHETAVVPELGSDRQANRGR